MDYGPVCERINDNGEPGFAWLENMRDYSRMGGNKDFKDHRVTGANPCCEQSLESYEICCLVETFPDKHDTVEDFRRTLKFAYLYAKTVTLGQTHWPQTNRVMLRNRRIGCSVSGIAQFVGNRGLHELRKWLDVGYITIQDWDKIYSDWLAVPRSIKTTSCKPSGTVSILAGATSGIHFPESRFYIRRIRLLKSSKLVEKLENSGFKLEPAVGMEDSTVVVEIPVDVGENIRTLETVSVWEQLSLAAFMQRYWADNQVSCTATFDPNIEGSQLVDALDYFQYQLKGISFLPRTELGAYPQMPYEKIDSVTYNKAISRVKELKFDKIEGEEVEPEMFCNNDKCELKIV